MRLSKFYYIVWLCMIMGVTLPMIMHEMQRKQYLVIIDPAGDAQHTGRHIGDAFERGLTLQCAEKIKEIIEQRDSSIKVIITRMPGDVVYELQNASLSNRVHADLFINLHFYYTQETKPTFFLYRFSYGNDFACLQGLSFNSYDQAYRINKEKTDIISILLMKELSQSQYHSLYTINGSYALPLKALIGVIAPAFTLEMGLKSKEAWQSYAEPLAQAIITTLTQAG